jgi:hypothetical protein
VRVNGNCAVSTVEGISTIDGIGSIEAVGNIERNGKGGIDIKLS